jgi:hypothetical protein
MDELWVVDITWLDGKTDEEKYDSEAKAWNRSG